jgi:hypothetical protein
MRLNKLCSMDLSYTDGFHLIRPYGGESGLGWGFGTGTVSGDRLSGTAPSGDRDNESPRGCSIT